LLFKKWILTQKVKPYYKNAINYLAKYFNMTEINQIRKIITYIREKYCLDKYKAREAIIIAPFGQEYFEKSVKNLIGSKAVRKLSKKENFSVIIVTSRNTDISDCPNEFKVIQMDSPPGWPANNSYLNRLIKWGMPLLFKNIGSSIYIDSNVIITNHARKIKKLFKIIKKRKFVNTIHSSRKNWEDEYDAIVQNKRCGNLETIEKQKDFLQTVNGTENIPICQNKFLGRIHSDEFALLNLEVLAQVFNFSERDQLGLVYAAHKTGKQPFTLEEGEILFTVFSQHVNINTVCFVQSKERYLRLIGRPFYKYKNLPLLGFLNKIRDRYFLYKI